MKNFRYLALIAMCFFLSPTFCQGQVAGFLDLDTDSDGKVSKEEFLEYTKGRMPDFDRADEFTDQLDADNNGFITEDEYAGRMEALKSLNLDGGKKKKEPTKEELKKITEATSAYKALSKLVSKNEWEKAAKAMTKQASDDYAIGMVTQSLSLVKMKLPPQIDGPSFEEAKEATIDAINDYKLGDIDMSFFLKRRSGRVQQKEANARKAKLKAEILAALDKDDQRWEIVEALRDAQKKTSFNRDVLAGKVGESDIGDSTVYLTVTQDAPEGQVAIPIVAKMKSEKGSWKYAGIDGSRTQRAMQKMQQEKQKQKQPGEADEPAKKEPDTDF